MVEMPMGENDRRGWIVWAEKFFGFVQDGWTGRTQASIDQNPRPGCDGRFDEVEIHHHGAEAFNVRRDLELVVGTHGKVSPTRPNLIGGWLNLVQPLRLAIRHTPARA